MERRAKVELFEQIRREYEFGDRDGKRRRAQAGRASADGASGAGQCRTAGAQAVAQRKRPVIGAVDALHRRDPGSRSQRAAQAASHRASHLAADRDGACRSGKWRK